MDEKFNGKANVVTNEKKRVKMKRVVNEKIDEKMKENGDEKVSEKANVVTNEKKRVKMKENGDVKVSGKATVVTNEKKSVKAKRVVNEKKDEKMEGLKNGVNGLTEKGMMKRVLKMLGLIAAIIVVELLLDGCSGGSEYGLAMSVIAGVAGGKHVEGEPLTLQTSREGSPELLRNEIDERIVKIRPMATPIDQISRHAGTRKCGSMTVEYYSVDTKAVMTKLTQESTVIANWGKTEGALLKTADDGIFEPSETIMVPEVMAENKAGERATLVLYVVAKDSAGISVIAVNNETSRGSSVPVLPAGTVLVRMGRAAAELDVQTPQFEALPTKKSNNCQIFKAQVEQSTYHKIANKEVGWSFSDQEEAAISDMRRGMEKNFLFGSACTLTDPIKNSEIMLTGGIWHQAGKECEYTKGALDMNRLIEISRAAFTGNGGSSKKLLIGGTMLIEELNKLEHVKTVGATETLTRWGLDFTEIVTKFGKLYVLASEIFDQCGHPHDGMIIDPEYLTKYSHVPFRTERLDLRRSGQRNTEAIVITEASCLVLRYPEAHVRVIGV